MPADSSKQIRGIKRTPFQKYDFLPPKKNSLSQFCPFSADGPGIFRKIAFKKISGSVGQKWTSLKDTFSFFTLAISVLYYYEPSFFSKLTR